MEKKVVYSLIAFSALSTGMAEAKDVDAGQQVKTGSAEEWESAGAYTLDSNVLTVSSSKEITQAIGKLQKGAYKLLLTLGTQPNFASDGKMKIKVEIGGTLETIILNSDANNQPQTVEFTLDSEQDVTLTLKGNYSARPFTAQGFNISVNFPDEEVAAELYKAQQLLTFIDGAGYATKAADLETATDYVEKLTLMNGNQTYDGYVTYKLYDESTLSGLDSDIEALKKIAENNQAAYLNAQAITNAQAAITALDTRLAAIDDANGKKAAATAAKAAADDALAGYKTEADAAAEAQTAAEFDADGEKLKAVQAAIKAYKDAVEAAEALAQQLADQLAGAGYDTKLAAINELKAVELTEPATNATYVAVQNAISAAEAALDAFKHQFDAVYTSGDFTEFEPDPEAVNQAIADLDAAVKASQENKAAYDARIAQLPAPKAAIAEATTKLAKYGTEKENTSNPYKAASDALGAVNLRLSQYTAAIEEAYAAGKAADITDAEIDAINADINELNNLIDAAEANYEAYVTTGEAIKAAKEDNANAVTQIAELLKDAKYATLLAAAQAELAAVSAQIEAAEAELAANLANGSAAVAVYEGIEAGASTAIVNKYMGENGKKDAFDAKLADIDGQKADFAELVKDKKGIDAPKADAEAAIDAWAAAVNENAANMDALAIADAEVAKNQTIQDVQTMIATLAPIQAAEAGLDAATAERKIEGVYDAATIYADQIAAIKAKIAALTAAINQAYEAAAPGAFAYDTSGALAEIENDIVLYNTDAGGAFNMFKDDYAVYTANLEAYNEVYNLVKDLEIYKDAEAEINGRNYTTLLNAAKATIDQQKAEADAAAATIGEDHFDAVVLLDFDNLVPGLNVLKENYQADQDEYERQYAQKSYQRIADRVEAKVELTEAAIEAIAAEITEEKLGPDYDKIKDKYDGLVQEFEAIAGDDGSFNSHKVGDGLTMEDYNEAAANVLGDQAELEKVSQKFTELKDKDIADAKANVAAKATADAALAALNTTLTETVKPLFVAEGDCADVAEFFAEDVATAEETYNKLVADVTTAYNGSTLKKAWSGPAEGDAQTLEAQANALAEKLAGIESDAKVKEAAYKANEAGYADAEAALDEVKDALTQAANDNTTAAKSYYEKILLGYAGELAELEAKIDASYAAWTSDADLEGQKAALNTLKGKINQVTPDALANEEAYNKQTLALAELKQLADEVAEELADKDDLLANNPDVELATIEELEKELAGYRAEIDAIDLLGLFINGKSALPLESGKTQSEEIDEYKVKVLAVDDAINGTYNAAVAAENISKKAAFDKEFGFATDAYTAAYNLWVDCSENLSDEGFKDAITPQTEAFHEALYAIAQDMKDTKDAAEAKYEEANQTPGTYFDYPSNYIQAAIGYKNTIENQIKKDFYDSVKDIVNNVWNETANEVTTAILNAQADFANNNIPFADNTFKEIEDLLAQGAEYAAATDIKNVDATIDALMKKTSGKKWYEKQIADAKDAAAKVKCAGDIAAKQLPEDYAEQFDSDFDDINAKYAAAYKKAADDLLAAATAANKDFSTMGDVAEILAQIEGALNDVIDEYNDAVAERTQEIAQAELDADAFAEINDAIAATQKKLDDAVADMAKLQNVDTDFDAEELQADIDALKLAKEEGAAAKQAAIENALLDIENDIDNYLNVAAALVQVDLLEYIEALKPAVNEAIAADFETGSAIQARLEELKGLIPAAATIAKLAEYQQEVYEIGESLDYDPYAAERAELLAVLETLAGKTLPSDDPRLTSQFAEPLAEQQAIVAAMTEAIQNDPSLSGADYDEDLADVEAKINQIIKDAKAFKTKMDQSDKKYNSLIKQLNGQAEIFEKVKADIEGYEYVDITKAPFKGMVTIIQTELDAITKTLDQNKEDVVLYTANRDVVNQRNAEIDEVEDLIQDLAETAADAEANAIADNFLDQLADVYYNPSRYSGAVQNDIAAQKQHINDMILEIYALAEEVTTGSIETMADVKALEAEITEAFEMLYKQLAEGTLGDVNGDGKVNVVDYQVIINHVLNGDDYVASYDVNNSGSVTVSDAAAIADLIIDGTNPETGGNYPIRYARAKQGSDEALTLQAVSATRFAVNLKNAREYTAFQMDIQLPEGLKVTAVSLGERAENHEVASRELANGKLRVIGSSIMNEAFAGSDGAVLYIDVELAQNAQAQLTLENVLFSDKASHDVAFRVKGQATGIKGLGFAVKERIYDLGGRMMNGIRKGISIVRGDNGSSKKVIK